QGYATQGLAFAPDGKVLASGSNFGGGVCLWEVATGRALQRLVVPNWATSVAFSPDGQRLAPAGDAAWLLDASTGKELRRLQPDQYLSLGVVAFSPDGRTLAAGLTRGLRAFGPKGAAVILWDAAAGKELGRLDGHEDVNALAFAPK